MNDANQRYFKLLLGDHLGSLFVAMTQGTAMNMSPKNTPFAIKNKSFMLH